MMTLSMRQNQAGFDMDPTNKEGSSATTAVATANGTSSSSNGIDTSLGSLGNGGGMMMKSSSSASPSAPDDPAASPSGGGNGSSPVIVTKPGQHDVLLGRGGGTNNHDGNVNFRNLVNQHKMRYLASSKIDKPKVAREVVTIWKNLTPPGRFLQKKETGTSGAASSSSASSSDGSSNIGASSPSNSPNNAGSAKRTTATNTSLDGAVWVEVSDKKAREKASQCLRERTADVMPYLTQLQQRREQMREQGVSMISQHLAAAQQSGEGLPTGRPQGRYGSLNLRMNGATPMMATSMGTSGSSGGAGSGMMDQALPNNRRVSMPAGGSATPVTPMNPKGTTAADRRMSMPVGGAKSSSTSAVGRAGLAGPGMVGSDGMEQQVLKDAYSAIERSGGPDPANVMYMEQLLQEERMMEREAMMAERQALMQERMMMQQERMMMQQRMSGQMSPFAGGQHAGSMMMMGNPGGWSPMGGGAHSGMPPNNFNEMMMMQQQQMMMQQQQQLGVVDPQQMMMQRQQPLGNMGASNLHMTPNSALSSGDHTQQSYDSHLGSMAGSSAVQVHPPSSGAGRPNVVTVVDMEPIPYLDDGSNDGGEIPLSIIPDVAQSGGPGATSSSKRSSAAAKNKSGPEKDDGKPAARGPSSAKAQTGESSNNRAEETFIPLKDPPPSSPKKLKSAFKRSTGSPSKRSNGKPPLAAAAAPGGQPADEACLVEYRKTLENYMSSHRINAPTAVDTLIDDDISDDEEDIGVDASAWIAQTLNDSGDVSLGNNKKKKRTKKDHSQGHSAPGQGAAAASAGKNNNEFNRPEPERGVNRYKSNESLMSTDARSFDGKSMDGMSLMSLAISEMEDKERAHKPGEKHHKSLQSMEGGHDSMESMEEESVDFAGRHTKMSGGRSFSSNHSVMSELTDFSDQGGLDSDEEDGVKL